MDWNNTLIYVGLIDLVKWFRKLTFLGLGDSKLAVEIYLATMQYESRNYKYGFLTADVSLFINFCSLFTRGVVEIKEGVIRPTAPQALTGQALRDYINNK
jgi:hypothetical protein